MQVKDLLKEIYCLQEDLPNLPGWWIKIYKELKISMDVPTECKNQWEKLQSILEKTLRIFLKNFKKWEVSSLDSFMERINSIPGTLLEMSLLPSLTNITIDYWKFCMDMEELEEKDCLDFQQNSIKDMSTLFMIAPSQMEPAGVSLKRDAKHLDDLLKDSDIKRVAMNTQSATGTQRSTITICKNGTNVHYTLTEPPGAYRLTVSTISVIIY